MSIANDTKEKIEVMQAFIEGRPLQYCKCGSSKWDACPVPLWDWYNYGYRVKPAAPDTIDWRHIAPRFEYCARDADGAVYLFEEKPFIPGDGSQKWSGTCYIRIDKFWQGVFTQGDIPWNESLLMRNDGGC